ncbi:unnamed protein product, partial [Mesorhabditis belari]|uniref:Uncharacterized protein n=1 Tax=Mesorhabditis belari TaxID=2138241 RepID=A0AAF3F034_9BILA
MDQSTTSNTTPKESSIGRGTTDSHTPPTQQLIREGRDLSQGFRRPHRTTSTNTTGSKGSKRSAFVGSRQTSEDSRTLRFTVNGEERQKSGQSSGKNTWMRRLSVAPGLAFRESGLSRIRVTGHLDYQDLRKRFERQSTFHGISHASLAPSDRWRYFWYAAFTICFIFLVVQVIYLILKYREYKKTVDLDLKFEHAPFPSVTLCNLNPYRKSSIMQNAETKKLMETFSKLVNKGEKTEGVAAIFHANLQSRVKRGKRRVNKAQNRRYHQVFAQCLCDVDAITGERKGGCMAAQQGKISFGFEAMQFNLHPAKCLCQLDTVSKSLWPCFPYSSWKEKLCIECVPSSGHCPMRFYKGKEKYEDIQSKVDICLCHKDYNHCIQNNEGNVIPEIGPEEEIATLNMTAQTQKALDKVGLRTTTTTTTEAPEVVEALGYTETDEIAITSQAQQNMRFAVASMNDEQKTSMSQNKEDFIKRCSFNLRDCQIDADFQQHYDQTYGNCFTFNFNRTKKLKAHRAGANYGLKVILYADIAEYLPTTEAVGFRITVHDKWIVPFPDAFGYNAPTGFLSAFGVRMKKFKRLGDPYGDCRSLEEGNKRQKDEEFFLYKNFNYSVEACHRSCTQQEIIEKCGCADPSYPLPKGQENCKAVDPKARECIQNTTIDIGNKIADNSWDECICHQPCEETNYEVTYSAARWPSGSANVMECASGDYLCLEKYKKNAAMIQVFYEELNYETMEESPQYTLTSALADLGGLTGLWIGASVVSLLEIVSLIIFCFQAWNQKRKDANTSNPSSLTTPVHKTSTRLSVNSSNKTRSKQSLLLLEDAPPIVEVTPRSSTSSLSQQSRPASRKSKSSIRYIPPDEELPCLCKFNDMGFIVHMKAMCPVHGYMVRRGYDNMTSEEEEAEEEYEEEHD